MSVRTRTITLGLAALVAAMPVAAQERGTIELGAFVANNEFDGTIDLKNAIGFGGRFGAYLHPRLSIEFEGQGGSASRPNGLADRSFRFIDARVLGVPATIGRLQLLAGLGAGHTDTHVQGALEGGESYGFHALLGAKMKLNESAALRLDGLQYMNGGDLTHRSIRLGVSLYRKPSARTEIRNVAGPATMAADSVSAAETRRLRAQELALRNLRDSLSRVPARPVPTASSVAALATMQEMITFERDQSTLSDSAKRVLDAKLPIFRANPEMKVVVLGYTSAPGTPDYNMALGLRRADATKEYLVSKGVPALRIEVATRGEGQLRAAGPSAEANAENRRVQFRLLVADPYLVKP